MADEMENTLEKETVGGPGCFRIGFTSINIYYQLLLDKSTPYVAVRWAVWFFAAVVYMIRSYILQGWYIVTYGLGIWLLNLFIAFLSPKIDPALSMDYDDDGPTLPTNANAEFRPFIRRLPEFKFWYSALRAVLVAFVCTFIDAFNVPVFWPILVMYFFILFTVTMKKQILHMIQYRYLPFSYGKRKYKGKDEVAGPVDNI